MKNNMKLTQSKLKQIIEEELQSVLKEETIKNKFNKWRQGRKLKKQSQELERYNNILENEPGLIERIKEFQKLSLELKELEKEHTAMPKGPDKRKFGKETLGATAREFKTVSDEMTRILKKVRSEHPDLARFLRQVGTKKDEKNPEGRTHPEHPPRAHRLRYAWEPRNWDQSRIDNWQKRRSDIGAIKPGSGLDWVRSLDESKLKQIVQEELQNALKEVMIVVGNPEDLKKIGPLDVKDVSTPEKAEKAFADITKSVQPKEKALDEYERFHVRPTMGEYTIWAPPSGRSRATQLYPRPFANIDDAKDHAVGAGYIDQYGPVEIQGKGGDVVSTWDTHNRRWFDALSESGR